MKVYSIVLLHKQGTGGKMLSASFNLSSFGYFQRGSVKEFLTFFSKTLVERTSQGTRQSVEEQQYVCHVHVRQDNLGAVVVCDQEYPRRVAFAILNKALDLYTEKYEKSMWGSVATPMPELEGILEKYQNPADADALTKVQQDLDDTKIILHKTIETVLERGEKIDSLVERSDDLSKQSKVFYTQARKTNSCCVIS